MASTVPVCQTRSAGFAEVRSCGNTFNISTAVRRAFTSVVTLTVTSGSFADKRDL